MISDVIDASRIIIEKNRNRIETSTIKLLPLARLMLSQEKGRLSTKIIEINNRGKELIFAATITPANQKSRLSSYVKTFVSEKGTTLQRSNQRLVSGTLNMLETKIMRVKVLESTSQLLNPENILHRGYSITSMNGRILKDKNQIKEGDTIDTQLYKGSLRSKVVERKWRNGERENG